MKKILLLLSFVLVCQNQLTAQVITPVIDNYNISVTRNDIYTPGVPGYVNSSATLYIKIGSNERQNSFSTTEFTPKNYNFPISYVFPGTPPLTRYVKVTFSSPFLYSGYYPLTTTVGSQTNIAADPNLIDYNGQFGYGVVLTCTAPNQYNMRVTRFECHLCIPGGGTVSKKANIQAETALVDRPDMGISELYYTAVNKEKISISVVDIHGKIVRAYATDIEAGLNKLPIDLQNQLGGIYLVKWTSSNGTNGTLKMVKK